MIVLGVNVEGVASLAGTEGGQADLVPAAVLAELGGADRIVIREASEGRTAPRGTLRRVRAVLASALDVWVDPRDAGGLERALAAGPERVTVEGGGGSEAVARILALVREAGVPGRVLVPPERGAVAEAARAGAAGVVLDAGDYTGAPGGAGRRRELERLRAASREAARHGLEAGVAGGLGEWNLPGVVRLEGVGEVVVGRAVLQRALLVGMVRAVTELRYLLAREVPAPRAMRGA